MASSSFSACIFQLGASMREMQGWSGGDTDHNERMFVCQVLSLYVPSISEGEQRGLPGRSPGRLCRPRDERKTIWVSSHIKGPGLHRTPARDGLTRRLKRSVLLLLRGLLGGLLGRLLGSLLLSHNANYLLFLK